MPPLLQLTGGEQNLVNPAAGLWRNLVLWHKMLFLALKGGVGS